jgi:5-methyltetrahydropteroyltriglutamate--homocysteine methyltransferase
VGPHGAAIGLEAFLRRCHERAELLNHALSGIPEEQIRYHICWGSWHGPHLYDLPLADFMPVLLSVHAGAYLVEAANVRHEHEYHLWERVKLPAGKVLIPGVVSHSTNLIEHPELVAERIGRYVRLLGRENVIAGTDCGMGGRIHPQLAWAKLEALVGGARLAGKALP